ncbi:MAG TPA: lamin tail domain-containing protein [Prosthecochloris aestuarii]|uniref:Lamin tail domain-containing protein n=1 Tax=Prosthecochloris aestuarii TaxID=1102 RepID=A0A831WRY9_PROAE|nr:lamin tail domain-containing protein [Prosthecochloris aestuarii]
MMRPHHLLLCLLLPLLAACQEYSGDAISISGPSLATVRTPGPVINEILFAPRSSASEQPEQPEYIEIFNAGQETVDLQGWTIQDCPTASGRRYSYTFSSSDGSMLLRGGEYAVLAPEETGKHHSPRILACYPSLGTNRNAGLFLDKRKTLSLNNDYDCVVLKNPSGEIIDSVAYQDNWHHHYLRETKGHALEKFNPLLPSCEASSWSSNLAEPCSGTPGKRNSLYLQANDLRRPPAITVTPETFIPSTHDQRVSSSSSPPEPIS